MPFRFRIRQSDRISDGKNRRKDSVIFAHLQSGQKEVLSCRRWVWGRSVYVAAVCLEDGELLVVISSDSPQTIISDYDRRWGIETLFEMFKTRRFCLKSSHFVKPERLSKLLALLAYALRRSIKTGEWLHQHQPLKVKKHGRLAKSVFRYGLDYLRYIVTDLDLKYHEFLNSLQFLSCT